MFKEKNRLYRLKQKNKKDKENEIKLTTDTI